MTSNEIVLEALSLVWIWLRPTLSKLINNTHDYSNPFDMYKKIAKKIKNKQYLCNIRIRCNIFDIRRNQFQINTCRAFKTTYIANHNSDNPENFNTIINHIESGIFLYKNNMDNNKQSLKVNTNENIWLKQNNIIIEILKALCVCCRNSKNIIV